MTCSSLSAGPSRASTTCLCSSSSSSVCALNWSMSRALSSSASRLASSRARVTRSRMRWRSANPSPRRSRLCANTSRRAAARASSRSFLSLTAMSNRRGSSPWSRSRASFAAPEIMCMTSRTSASAPYAKPVPGPPSPRARRRVAEEATSVAWCASWYGLLYARAPRRTSAASASRLDTSASRRGVGANKRCRSAIASFTALPSTSRAASRASASGTEAAASYRAIRAASAWSVAVAIARKSRSGRARESGRRRKRSGGGAEKGERGDLRGATTPARSNFLRRARPSVRRAPLAN